MIKLKPIVQQIITEELTVQTYGQLKSIINAIKTKQKAVQVWDTAKSKMVDAVVDELIGKIPGGAIAKNTFDFFRAASKKPDSVKTKTWLDKLDIDDEVLKIVDDTIEAGFLQDFADRIDKEADNAKLPEDFNMNIELQNYISNKHKKRTVSYQEN
jgi:hypothetical protein